MDEAKDRTVLKQKQHIQEMKERLKAHGGVLNLDGFKSLDAQERFLEQVLFMEEAGENPLFDQLEEKGMRLPPPKELDDTQIHEKLWDVINAMALTGHYLCNTDHLSDRQLYELLWNEILRQPSSVNPDPSTTSCQIDILGGCSDEDLKIRLKYYADDDERECWEGDFPEDEIPSKEPLPYDRDRHLPVPAYNVF